MHRVETGKQAAYDAGRLPARKCALEFRHRGDGRVKGVEDILQARKARRSRPKAGPAVGINFMDAGAQNIAPYY